MSLQVFFTRPWTRITISNTHASRRASARFAPSSLHAIHEWHYDLQSQGRWSEWNQSRVRWLDSAILYPLSFILQNFFFACLNCFLVGQTSKPVGQTHDCLFSLAGFKDKVSFFFHLSDYEKAKFIMRRLFFSFFSHPLTRTSERKSCRVCSPSSIATVNVSTFDITLGPA